MTDRDPPDLSSSEARHSGAFPELDPPPGGLARLRARLDHADKRRARLLTLAFVPALGMAAVLFLVVTRPAPLPALNHPSLASPRDAGAAVAGGVAVPLSEKATLYWVP